VAAGQGRLCGPRIVLQAEPMNRLAVEQQPAGEPLAGPDADLAHDLFRYASGYLEIQVLTGLVQQAEEGHVGVEAFHDPVDDKAQQIPQVQAGGQALADLLKDVYQLVSLRRLSLCHRPSPWQRLIA
jgi:hypothetical protein